MDVGTLCSLPSLTPVLPKDQIQYYEFAKYRMAEFDVYSTTQKGSGLALNLLQKKDL